MEWDGMELFHPILVYPRNEQTLRVWESPVDRIIRADGRTRKPLSLYPAVTDRPAGDCVLCLRHRKQPVSPRIRGLIKWL
jgi:hypothetical protein